MMGAVVGLTLLWVLLIGLVVRWSLIAWAHERRIGDLDLRLHVNGIRGKSTVTRLIAAVLREGGFVTVAKTTGTAARVIGPLGEETPIRRWGAPTINEQVVIIREHVSPDTEALVVECMAVRPRYQKDAQEIVRPDVTVITNVRLDHQDEMGETLEEIADSLALTIPKNGVLITAEGRPELRQRLAARAAALGTRTVYANPRWVTDEDLAGFDYLQFKENIAVGIALANIAGISRQDALRGMWNAVPDSGVVRLRTYDVRGKQVLWVPLFAANDRESVVSTLAGLRPAFPPNAAVIAILNNRQDRGRRAEHFVDVITDDLSQHLDHIVLFGAYEGSVAARIIKRGIPADRVHRLGNVERPSLDEILDEIADMIPGESGVLIGLVNIHTRQAASLGAYFADQAGDQWVDELELSRDPARQPMVQRRVRWQAARHDTG